MSRGTLLGVCDDPVRYIRDNLVQFGPGRAFRNRARRQSAFLAVISTPSEKKSHFSGLFCDFSLRSCVSLAIVPSGPSLFAEKHGGSELAACPDCIGVCSDQSRVQRQFRRISRLDGQATEQDEGRIPHGREGRHTEENRSSLF